MTEQESEYVICASRVDHYARDNGGKRQVADAARLLDDILAREIVATLLEYLLK
jgi:hypothetical protein